MSPEYRSVWDASTISVLKHRSLPLSLEKCLQRLRPVLWLLAGNLLVPSASAFDFSPRESRLEGCSPNLQQQCRSDYLAYYTCCHGDCCIHLQPIPYVFLCIVVFLFIIAVCYGCCSLACNWCCCCRQKQTGPHLPYS